MTRGWCWIMAFLTTFGAMASDWLVTSLVLGVVALAWLRAAAREAARESWRNRWL